MGYGIETVGAALTNVATATAQGLAAMSPQSLSIRAAATNTTPVTLDVVWHQFQDAGDLRIRSPRLHDDVNALRFPASTVNSGPLADEYFDQEVFSQDTLIVEGVFAVAPTAGHLSTAFLNIVYDDVPGIAANMRDWAGVSPNIKNYLVVPVSPTSGQGVWGAGVAINSTVDTFKANTSYALIGYDCGPTVFGAWTIYGVDTGNLQIGGPYMDVNVDTRRWFAYHSQMLGKPYIPIINSQNKGATLVQSTAFAAAAATPLNLIFAELSA